MARKQYPQLHSIRYSDAVEADCVACERIAIATARVEWSYMRGEDEFEPVCRRHAQMAENQFKRFIAHMNTKEEFLKRCEQ